MPKIKFYHIRTLLWTYLVWSALNLLIALGCCRITKYPLTNMPYYWAVLHIIPLIAPINTLWHGDMDGFIISAAALVVAGFAIVGGLIIKKVQWARFLIIIGMSIWFLGAFFILAMGA